eukprot:11877543-Prorocentrum_lima.AAC.1
MPPPGKDRRGKVKHDARARAPGNTQVLFGNAEKNDLKWIIRLIKTCNVKWTFYNLPYSQQDRLE